MTRTIIFIFVLLFSFDSFAIGSPSLSSSRSSMYLGETTYLSWSKPNGTSYFNLWVTKPGQSASAFRRYYTDTSFNRWIQNYPGTHTFYVEACDSNNSCSASNSVSVHMSERPTKPDTPGEPNVNNDLYHPAGSSIMVYIPSISRATYYEVLNGTTPTDVSSRTTFYNGGTLQFIPSHSSSSNIANYIRIKACNSEGCSEESPPRKVAVFINPGIPNLSLSAEYLSKGSTLNINWNRPDNMIWRGAYFNLRCITNSGVDVCNQKIEHVGGSNKTEYSYSIQLNEVNAYDIQVEACNKSNAYCTSSTTRTSYVVPDVPQDPGAYLNWDLYYPQNTPMTLNLPQSINGADSFDIYYYRDGTSPQLYKHVARTQQSTAINVGDKGKYNLEVAACVTSRTGSYKCSAKSQTRSIASFINPDAPTISVSSQSAALGDQVTINWNKPNNFIWSGAYFKVSCITSDGEDVCGVTIPHIGGSNKANYSHNFVIKVASQYRIQVKACNKTDSNCTNSQIVTLSVKPDKHDELGRNLNWDFYYYENTLMTVYLSQDMAGVDSFDVYYYPEDEAPIKVKRVAKSKGSIEINVGLKGKHTLQLAGCIANGMNVAVCGELSEKQRIVSFGLPDKPTVSITPNPLIVGTQAQIKWTKPKNMIWSGSYFKLSCQTNNKLEACGQTIQHVGGSQVTEYSQEIIVPSADKLDVQVKVCNKTDNYCVASDIVSSLVSLPTHGDPSKNIGWKFHYPKNTMMTINLDQTIKGIDSFDVYFYPEDGQVPNPSHVSMSQLKLDVNVGKVGSYNLQIAACVSNSGGQYRCGEKSKIVKILVFDKLPAPKLIVKPNN
ncbi:hypothetical protein [Pseudoalteromonas xiamenensis]